MCRFGRHREGIWSVVEYVCKVYRWTIVDQKDGSAIAAVHYANIFTSAIAAH